MPCTKSLFPIEMVHGLTGYEKHPYRNEYDGSQMERLRDIFSIIMICGRWFFSANFRETRYGW